MVGDWTIDDPPDEDAWVLSGPGIEETPDGPSASVRNDELTAPPFPGGVDHTTAAYGGGGGGLALLGIIGLIRRRRARRRIRGPEA